MRLSQSSLIVSLLLAGLVLSGARPVQDAERFSRTTIDVGVVVSDLERSAAFYTEALGFTEVDGFSVSADFCTDAGLTDNHPLTVRVFVLGEGESATKLKLMELPDVKSKPGDHAFIHSQLGLSYLSVFVTSMDAALARAKAAGVHPLAESPVQIGAAPGPLLTLVRDPDGNLIELIGPGR